VDAKKIQEQLFLINQEKLPPSVSMRFTKCCTSAPTVLIGVCKDILLWHVSLITCAEYRWPKDHTKNVVCFFKLTRLSKLAANLKIIA
jgi:hypothetical protein